MEPARLPIVGQGISGPQRAIGLDAEVFRSAALAPLLAFRSRIAGAQAKPARELCAAVWLLLEEINAPARLEEWAERDEAAGRPAEADAHRQELRLVRDLLDDTVEALGGRAIAPADFAASLEAALAEATIGQVPAAADVVLVGDLERSRFPALRAALVLGAGEGLFPRPAAEDPLLDDADRRRLAEAGCRLSPTAEQRQFDETMLAYTALTRAGGRLWISWPRRDADGRPINPSALVTRLRAVFPELSVRSLDGMPRGAANFDTVESLAAAIAVHGQADSAGPVPVSSPADRGGLFPGLGSAAAETAIEPMLLARQMARDAGSPIAGALEALLAGLSDSDDRTLPADLAERLYGRRPAADVAQLERFAACPFRHFVRHVLKPAAPSPQRPAGFDLVRVHRGAVERFSAGILRVGSADGAAARAQMDAALRGAVREAAAPSARLTARQRFHLGRGRRLLHELADSLVSAMRTERWAGRRAGVAFGGDDGDALPALVVPLAGEAELVLSGRIARVDSAAGAEGTLVAVREHRGGPRSVSLARIWHGLSLRPAVHLLVLRAHGGQLFAGPVVPAAAVQMSSAPAPSRRSAGPAPNPSAPPPPPSQAPAVRQRGLLVEDFLTFMEPVAGPGRSQHYRFRLDKDGGVVDKGRSDVLSAGQLDALLDSTAERLRELAERLAGGEIGVRPYRLGVHSPCAGCDAREVCRFDPARHPVRPLEDLDRAAVLRRLE